MSALLCSEYQPLKSSPEPSNSPSSSIPSSSASSSASNSINHASLVCACCLRSHHIYWSTSTSLHPENNRSSERGSNFERWWPYAALSIASISLSFLYHSSCIHFAISFLHPSRDLTSTDCGSTVHPSHHSFRCLCPTSQHNVALREFGFIMVPSCVVIDKSCFFLWGMNFSSNLKILDKNLSSVSVQCSC